MKNTLLVAAAFGLFSVASCNNASSGASDAPKTDSTSAKMENKQERNKKIIMAATAGVNAHDANKVMKDAAPDFVDYGDGSMPPMKGDSAKQMMAMFLTAFPDMRSSNEMYLADGNNVAVAADWTLTFKNDMMGMKATNKSTTVRDVDIFTLDDNGKIISHRSTYPMGAMMMQMGCDMSKMEGGKDMKKDDKKKM